jgi:general secretion pathway protein D
MKRKACLSLLSGAAMLLASRDTIAQATRPRVPLGVQQPVAPQAGTDAPTPPAPPPAGGAGPSPGGGGATSPSPGGAGGTGPNPGGGGAAGAGGTTPSAPPSPPAAGAGAGAGRPPAGGGGGAGTPSGGAGAGGAATGGAAGKGATPILPGFEQGQEIGLQPKRPGDLVAFSFEDADLPELVRTIGQITGKRFIFGGKVRTIKATLYSPQKVTVAEAYQAFLSILETNGLTVIPHGRFLKIVETGGVATQTTPTYVAGQGAPPEDRYVTRMHRLSHVSADEVAGILGHFKTKDGDITVYGPGNLLIITDTGSNIRRMMQIVEDVDVGSAGDQIWIEPIHYASAADISNRVNELFDLKGGGSSGGGGGGAPASGGKGGGTTPHEAGGGELHVSKLLADDRSNSIIIVATERAYLRVLEIIRRLDVPQTGEGEIHVLPLQHADATELTKTLTEIITGAGAATTAGGAPAPTKPGGTTTATGIFEAGIKVSADKATNSIVVTSSLRDYASLRAVIDKLDLPRRQVFIEAVVMDLSIRRSDTLGVNFHAADTAGLIGPGDSLLYGGLNPLKTILLPDPSTLQGMALGVRGPGIPGSENLLGTGLTIPAFGAIINALASDGDADVLSTPHILATDNEDAEINVGENIPLQTNVGLSLPGLPSPGGAPGAPGGAPGGFGFPSLGTSGARTDVGTKIKIKPHLNESNEVRLDLQEEISEARDPQGQLGVVPITKRNATTKLIVRDQQTVVIGGLMRNRLTHTQDKIPILGDIPVLGALFRTTTNGLEKSNLILILTPFIIREQSDLRTIFERKMQERQQFLDRYFVFSDRVDYQPPHDYSRTTGLLEEIRQAYESVEERKRLDELAAPKEVKGHEPGQPLEMPAGVRSGSSSSASPPPTPADRGGTPPAAIGTPGNPAPTPQPNINVTPPPRGVERIEK